MITTPTCNPCGTPDTEALVLFLKFLVGVGIATAVLMGFTIWGYFRQEASNGK